MSKRLLLLFLLVLNGCGGPRHKRENLQREYPDCIVTEDFEIKCPEPDWFPNNTHP